MASCLPNLAVLTLRQPWASAVAYGTKRVENRTWPTSYRGWLLLHAGVSIDRNAIDVPMCRPFLNRPQPHGAFLALVWLADCHADDGWCSLWSAPGCWHWRLTRVTTLPHPVACPGDRGLWTPPAHLLIHPTVREALEGATHA